MQKVVRSVAYLLLFVAVLTQVSCKKERSRGSEVEGTWYDQSHNSVTFNNTGTGAIYFYGYSENLFNWKLQNNDLIELDFSDHTELWNITNVEGQSMDYQYQNVYTHLTRD